MNGFVAIFSAGIGELHLNRLGIDIESVMNSSSEELPIIRQFIKILKLFKEILPIVRFTKKLSQKKKIKLNLY